MISAATRQEYEAQATACLEAAEKYQPQLLALATNMAGSKEEGMELFQQAAMDCHDAIQTGGFQGEAYQFYLRRAIKNLHYKTVRQQQRRVSLVVREPAMLPEEQPAEWEQPVELNAVGESRGLWVPATLPGQESQAALAERILEEARQKFSLADRVALHLSLDGMSCQMIAELIGMKDQSWVWRRLQRMKQQLRATFAADWANLDE